MFSLSRNEIINLKPFNKRSQENEMLQKTQGCALSEPGSPWRLTFALRRLDFSYKFYAGHPRFYSFRALSSLQFSLEHSLATYPSLTGLCSILFFSYLLKSFTHLNIELCMERAYWCTSMGHQCA